MIDNLEKVYRFAVGIMLAFIFPFFQDYQIQMFLLIMFFDYATGIMVAIKQKNISSRIYIYGFFKKIMMLCFISVTHPFEITTGLDIKGNIIFLLAVGEGISIVENLGNLGVIVNNNITQFFSQILTHKGLKK